MVFINWDVMFVFVFWILDGLFVSYFLSMILLIKGMMNLGRVSVLVGGMYI